MINFSNHPYERWSDRQKDAARVYGDTVDMPFYAVPAKATEEDISEMSYGAVKDIEERINYSTDAEVAVMVQGEFTLTYAVVSTLLKRHVRVISACSERRVTESVDNEGNPIKQVDFRFERFREYR